MKALETLTGRFVLDGELVDQTYHIFDILKYNDIDLTGAHYENRYQVAKSLHKVGILDLATHLGVYLTVSYTAFDTDEKQALFEEAKQRGAEGIVIKHKDAPYTVGRPNSGGDQLKCKFYDTASCIVEGVNRQRSISLYVYNDQKQKVQVGNCTIPPNHQIPSPEDVVEIRYLYAYENGCLYQPVYLGKREDIDTEECLTKQLKYKPTMAYGQA